MRQIEFYGDTEAKEFINWLSDKLNELEFNLVIPSSARVPGGVRAVAYGLDEVVSKYKWHSSWKDLETGEEVVSCNWESTGDSLTRLSKVLREGVATKNEAKTFQACCQVFDWGGERNPKVGARRFLSEKLNNSALVDYLCAARQEFCLGSADLNRLSAIEKVNSMLTKVYALLSDDELPIYDTRVAVAIAGLVEVYRIDCKKQWGCVPEVLSFPVPPEGAGTNRRRLKFLNADALTPKPEVLYYTTQTSSLRWVSAKIRLGWIIKAVLKRNCDLLTKQSHARHHAFEAALFMVGYDIRSLRMALQNTA